MSVTQSDNKTKEMWAKLREKYLGEAGQKNDDTSDDDSYGDSDDSEP